MFWPDPTHQPTHPPTLWPNHTPTHGWGSLHRFQIFKWNWNISINSSAIEFWLIPGVPPWGVGGGWMWVGDGERVCPTHVHTHAHARTCAYDIIGKSKGFPQWGQPFAWNYHVYHACMCMCVCACMSVHVDMCGRHPQTTPHPHTPIPHPHTPTPHPQSRREPKTPKFNKSWTNRDNSILFDNSLPLNIPELI